MCPTMTLFFWAALKKKGRLQGFSILSLLLSTFVPNRPFRYAHMPNPSVVNEAWLIVSGMASSHKTLEMRILKFGRTKWR